MYIKKAEVKEKVDENESDWRRNSVMYHAGMLSQCGTGQYPGFKRPLPGSDTAGERTRNICPGVISKDGNQSKLFLTPDGTELIFSSMLIVPGKENNPAARDISFISMKMVDDIWGEPVVLPFSREFTNDEPALSYDGKKIFSFPTDRKAVIRKWR